MRAQRAEPILPVSPPPCSIFLSARKHVVFTLNGKKALVTGASGGIGGAIAKALTQQGAEVALSGTRMEALEAAAKEIGGKTHIVPCDLGDAAQVDKLIENAG